ncbi:MAG: T9SS type A sorting domain-containing protein, partial [Thermoanaerobaculia bacterium]|nr:T9SS type A sorting domain-containing protein [Thermoanaerobaculia bacterium]
CQLINLGLSQNQHPLIQKLVSVSPNPFFDRLNVSLGVESDHLEFHLLDLAGRKVFTSTLVNDDNEILVEGLPAGIYIWELSMLNVRLNTGKLIKTGR